MFMDVKDEMFEAAELDGKSVAFTNRRISRDTVPEGLYCYEIRDSDRLDRSCAEVKKYVMLHHRGTILCKEPLELNERGSYYPEKEMNFLGVSVSIDEWLEMGKEQMEHPQTSDFGMTMK